METRDIVVIGSSAGGIPMLVELVSRLPAPLSAALLVVVHTSPAAPSMLPSILSKAGPLPASHPEHGAPIAHGQIYVARPDYHLLVREGRIALSRAPKENGHRPAVDALFQSAAQEFGRRVVGVVLTGNLDDGTAGLLEVKRLGGTAVVQSPDEAPFKGMPLSAIAKVKVDHVATIAEIAQLIARLAGTK